MGTHLRESAAQFILKSMALRRLVIAAVVLALGATANPASFCELCCSAAASPSAGKMGSPQQMHQEMEHCRECPHHETHVLRNQCCPHLDLAKAVPSSRYSLYTSRIGLSLPLVPKALRPAHHSFEICRDVWRPPGAGANPPMTPLRI